LALGFAVSEVPLMSQRWNKSSAVGHTRHGSPLTQHALVTPLRPHAVPQGRVRNRLLTNCSWRTAAFAPLAWPLLRDPQLWWRLIIGLMQIYLEFVQWKKECYLFKERTVQA